MQTERFFLHTLTHSQRGGFPCQQLHDGTQGSVFSCDLSSAQTQICTLEPFYLVTLLSQDQGSPLLAETRLFCCVMLNSFKYYSWVVVFFSASVFRAPHGEWHRGICTSAAFFSALLIKRKSSYSFLMTFVFLEFIPLISQVCWVYFRNYCNGSWVRPARKHLFYFSLPSMNKKW